jgi:DNA-directed RNA polymerase subunit RPC12/RpoP
MVLVHIARAGQVLGRYPEADLPVLIGAGTVRRTDHYWKKGMAGWSLVGATFDPPKPKPAPAPSAPPPIPRKPDPRTHLRYECLRCGAKFNETVDRKPGSAFLEIIYWCITPWAGGAYSASRSLGKTSHCPRCDSEQIHEEVW